MRVLFLDHTAELGGAELSLLSVLTYFPRQARVLLFEAGPFKNILAASGFDVCVLKTIAGKIGVRRESGMITAIKSIPAVIALILGVAGQAAGCDVIYANSQKAFIVGAFSGVFLRRPVVWHLHDVLTADHFGRFLRRFVVLVARLSGSWVIANSQATAAAFQQLGGNAARVTVIHQGIDEAEFLTVNPDDVAQLRQSLGDGSAPLIGVFGRLTMWKGQKIFLDALARIPNAIGVIVGDALFGESAYASELVAYADKIGLARRVKFLGFRNDIPALMSAMDIIIHASIAPEPFGRVVVEGMLAGIPVIAAAGGGVLEIIEDGKTGFLYEPGNAAALAARIKNVLEMPCEADIVARSGQRRAREQFTAQRSVAQITSLIETILAA